MNLLEREKTHLLLARRVSEANFEKIFLELFRGRLSPVEIKTLLLLLAKRGEDSPAIDGCLKALRSLEPPRSLPLPFLMDVCGTGGDRSGTFNVSTVSSFVIAGAGAYVAKHGNRSVSSQAGSTDLMEALGVRVDIPYPQMIEALQKCHLGYFHAPLYHPSFSPVQTVRRELGIRTIFNLLGPLVNPIRLQYQGVGVSHPEWLGPMAEALRHLGRIRAAVFHSRDGLDELSTHAANDILYLEKGRIRRFRLDPQPLGFSNAKKNDYQGGDLKTNREIALQILHDRMRDPRRDIVLLNSGFALWLVGLVATLPEGIEKSRWTIRSGRALGVLEGLRLMTRKRKS